MMDSVNVMKRIIEGKKRTDHQVDSEVDFDDILRKSSSEEIFLEYCTLLRSLPPLIEVERKKVVGIVRKELGIDAI